MTGRDYYLSPADYEEAARKGIHRDLLYDRVYLKRWPKARAINTPIREQVARGTLKSWKQLAQQNGISTNLFNSRFYNCGWSAERAATEPIQDPRTALAKAQQDRRVISAEDELTARSNGVSFSTLHSRIRAGWSLEQAIAIPPIRNADRLNYAKEKTKRGLVFREKELTGDGQQP